jgi:hypothetical protein
MGFRVKREMAIYFSVSVKKHFILQRDFLPGVTRDSPPEISVSVNMTNFLP